MMGYPSRLLLESFSAVYHKLAPGRQPVWTKALVVCKGVVISCRSPAFICIVLLSMFIYCTRAARLIMTGRREGQMSWHKRLTQSRAPSQTLCFPAAHLHLTSQLHPYVLGSSSAHESAGYLTVVSRRYKDTNTTPASSVSYLQDGYIQDAALRSIGHPSCRHRQCPSSSGKQHPRLLSRLQGKQRQDQRYWLDCIAHTRRHRLQCLRH